jgi:hypothetical protein
MSFLSQWPTCMTSWGMIIDLLIGVGSETKISTIPVLLIWVLWSVLYMGLHQNMNMQFRCTEYAYMPAL